MAGSASAGRVGERGAFPALERYGPWLFAGLVLLGFALHARAIGFGFVNFDDTTILLRHPNLYDETSLRASLYEIFVGYFPREEPLLLRDVSWAIDARLFGFENPVGYHLGNVLWNAVNGGLLFLFLRRATRRSDFAAIVAALFCTLPVHVEPVSWVMGRKDVLSAFFVLLALWAQSVELDTPPSSRRRAFYLLGLLATGLALLSKMGALACVIVLGLYRVFRDDLDGTRRPEEPFDWASVAKRLLPLAPHTLLTAGVAVWFTRIVGSYGVTGWRGLGPGDPEHLWNVARFAPLSIGRYVRQVFLPHEPSLYYRWPHVEIPLSTLEMLGAALIALALAAGVVAALRWRRDLAFYALAFLAFLLPYLNVVYIGIWSANRYVYLASFCLLALAVSGLLALAARGPALRNAVVASLVAFGVGSSAYTLQHQTVWRDDESLWRYEAYRSEPSLLSIQALARGLMQQASAENDPARRAALIAEARVEIARGFAREQALGRVPVPYATSEQLQLSRFHYLLGRLDKLEQAPPQQQIEHFEAAHALAPNRANTLMLAGAYFDWAATSPATEQEALLHRSLDYFLEHVAFSSSDPRLHRQSLALLENNYARRFPFLQERVARATAGNLP